MIELILLGVPRPLARPRFSRQGHVYNSQSREMLIDYLDLKKQWGNRPLLIEPIHIDIQFIFPIPSSYNATKRKLMNNSFHAIRPDVDNLIKKP